MTVKISCKLNHLFDTWHLWIIEFDKNEYSCVAEEEQEDFDNLIDKLYQLLNTSIKHINCKYTKHQKLSFMVKDDINYVVDKLLDNCNLNQEMTWL